MYQGGPPCCMMEFLNTALEKLIWQTGNCFLFYSWKKPLWVLKFVASTTDGIFNDSENEKFLSNFFRLLPVIFESVIVAQIFLYKFWDLLVTVRQYIDLLVPTLVIS
jgi:hypothetical protein